MKTKLSLLGIIASLGAVATVSAQTTAVTKPVGYHTETVLANKFTLLGINVGNGVQAAGVFDADSATDNDVDYTTLLTADTPYTVQNTATGEHASVTAWDATTLTLDPDIAISTDDGYEIREDATVNSIFGVDNAAGLGAGDSSTADILWIPNADGSWTRIFQATAQPPFRTAGWRGTATGGTVDVGGTVIPFNVGIFVQSRQEDNLDVVFVGHVRTKAVTHSLNAGKFNFVNRVLPVGIALADSGLETAPSWQAGDSATADMIWLPDGAGGYDRIYYATAQPPFRTEGWRGTATGGTADQGGKELTAGYAIQKRGAAGSVTVAIPSDLDLGD